MKNIKYTDLFIGFLGLLLMIILHVGFYLQPHPGLALLLCFLWLAILVNVGITIMEFLEKKDKQRGL